MSPSNWQSGFDWMPGSSCSVLVEAPSEIFLHQFRVTSAPFLLGTVLRISVMADNGSPGHSPRCVRQNTASEPTHVVVRIHDYVLRSDVPLAGDINEFPASDLAAVEAGEVRVRNDAE